MPDLTPLVAQSKSSIPIDGAESPRVLVFTLAFNGYGWRYRSCISAQRRYAQRCGYSHVLVRRPRWTTLTREAAWTKIWLIREALRAGWDWVAFIDCDAEPRSQAPPLHKLETPGKCLYFAPGFSGRINSGVMILKNEPGAVAFIGDVIENCEKPVPKEDALAWGENGHVIHYAKNHVGLEMLDPRWNNNRDPNMDDHIRHYSNGAVRDVFEPSMIDKALFTAESNASRLAGRVVRRLRGQQPASTLRARVEHFADQCVASQPLLTRPPQ